ncbi:FadR/GntR family transcriptional regulator [Embleya scabrispora]|uniref:FadR/GntR family transcriptional regulator n=1 Tax=Embleya scabrispora TaxID=159449 RepID=UPI00035DE3F0|nr:GntR family transcriptional regulator [Embleya scabrispora]MYS84604.1 GntR family transcriptional regulator [Streptomyces sp. SID5474]
MNHEQSDDPFHPVIVRSAAAQAADRIVAAIRDSRVARFERLPSERDLAQRLGVSRPTLREALAALELAGIVQSHHGRGTLVVASASRVANWGVEILPTQLFEARLAIEPQLAELAAAKCYPEDIEHLKTAARHLEEEFEATGQYESDLPVHRAIARAARNPILEHALEEALLHTESPRWVTLRSRALIPGHTREGHVDEVRRVIRHIENGEGKQAADVWRRHLLYFRDEMLTGLKERPLPPDAEVSG